MLAALVVVPAIALALSLSQTARYEASAKVLLQQRNLASALTGVEDPNASVPNETLVQTQVGVARVPEVADRVVERIDGVELTSGELLAGTEVTADPDTQILTFTAESEDPELAATLAAEYARQYTRYRRNLDTESLGSAREAVEERLAELAENGEGGSSLYRSLVRRDEELRTLETLQTSNANVIQTPTEALQVAPRPVRDAFLGLLLGAVLGLGLAFLREALDTSVRNAEEVAERLELPLLARIPPPPKELRGKDALVTMAEPAGPHAEVFRMLRTNLEFSMLDGEVKSLMITSALPSEGKSTTAANLALAFARAGNRVIIVDLDLRRPRLDKLFGQSAVPGVTDVLVGKAQLAGALRFLPLLPDDLTQAQNGAGDEDLNSLRGNTGDGSLELLTSGRLPPDAGELIASTALASLLGDLGTRADLIIVDTPPMLQVGDSMKLSSIVDAMVVAARIQLLRRGAVSELHRLLATAPARKLGFVLTGAQSEASYGYQQGYYSRPPVSAQT